MAGKHTPLPWRVVKYGDGDSLAIHDARGDWRVCFMATPGEDGDFEGIEANAEFIVRACNSHDELLEALERAEARFAHIRDRLNSGRLDTATRRASFANDVWHMECEARSAIAKAKGEDGEASNG